MAGNVFRSIIKAGYTGFVGLEMWPTIDHATAVKETLTVFNESFVAKSVSGV